MEILFDKPETFCPICNDSNISFWHSKSREAVKYNIFRCNKCTSGFLNPRVTEGTLLKIYDKSGHGLTKPVAYEDIIQREKEYPNSTVDAERIVSYAYRQLLKNKKKEQLKAVDIGSGFGFYSLCAKKYGFKVTSINPGEYENVICEELFRKEGLKADIHVGVFKDFKLKKESFDLVILSQVLEHIREPYNMLEDIKEILAPGGIIAIAVPNFNSIFVKVFGVKDNSCLWVPEHCNYFTETSLRKTVEKLSLKLIKCEHICRLPYYAISERLKLTPGSFLRIFVNQAFKVIQFVPCKICKYLGVGNYFNVFYMKE